MRLNWSISGRVCESDIRTIVAMIEGRELSNTSQATIAVYDESQSLCYVEEYNNGSQICAQLC